MNARIDLLGMVPGTRIVIAREGDEFTLHMFNAKTGTSLAFAYGERARVSIDAGGARVWIGHANIALRTAQEARRVADTLKIGLKDQRAEVA